MFGDYFHASLKAKRDEGAPSARSERASLTRLLRHGCTPHRVAFWIYQQALVVLWKGVQFFPPPGLAAVSKVRERFSKLSKVAKVSKKVSTKCSIRLVLLFFYFKAARIAPFASSYRSSMPVLRSLASKHDT